MSEPTATAQPPAPTPATTALPPLELVKGRDLVAELPAVNEAAVAAISGAHVTGQAVTPPGPSRSDSLGRAFDAKIFRVNADGSPFLKRLADGREVFMPRGGRKPNAAPSSTGSAVPADLPGFGGPAAPAASPSPSPAIAPVAVSPSQHSANADAVLRGSYALGNLVSGSSEWKPDSDSEHEALRDSYVAWANTRPGAVLPPLVLFAMNVLVFVVNRLFRPKTAERLCRWFPKLRGILTDEPVSKSEPTKPAEPPVPKQPPAPFAPVHPPRPNFEL